MADDIVTRLLDVVCWCNEFDGVCDACQAADEIERLRAAGDAMSEVIRSGSDRNWDTALDAWQEARHG